MDFHAVHRPFRDLARKGALSLRLSRKKTPIASVRAVLPHRSIHIREAYQKRFGTASGSLLGRAGRLLIQN